MTRGIDRNSEDRTPKNQTKKLKRRTAGQTKTKKNIPAETE
jgi:hypothetical protein